ncbi:MAG: hypothetical protein ACRDA4_08155 [Filifactoraceae bacterium]
MMEQWEIEFKNKENEILRKVENKEYLTESEVKHLVYQGYVIDEIEKDTHRWVTYIWGVVEIQKRFFKVYYALGNTEMQENEYPRQKLTEVKSVKKIIETEEWEEI